MRGWIGKRNREALSHESQVQLVRKFNRMAYAGATDYQICHRPLGGAEIAFIGYVGFLEVLLDTHQ